MNTQNEALSVLCQLVIFLLPKADIRGQKQHFFQHPMSSIISVDLPKACVHLLWRETTSQPANSFHGDSLKN